MGWKSRRSDTNTNILVYLRGHTQSTTVSHRVQQSNNASHITNTFSPSPSTISRHQPPHHNELGPLPTMATLVCNTPSTTWDAADTISPNSAIEAVTSQNTINSNVHFLSSNIPSPSSTPASKPHSNPSSSCSITCNQPPKMPPLSMPPIPAEESTRQPQHPTQHRTKNSPSTCPLTAASRFQPSSPPRSPNTAYKRSSHSSTP